MITVFSIYRRNLISNRPRTFYEGHRRILGQCKGIGAEEKNGQEHIFILIHSRAPMYKVLHLTVMARASFPIILHASFLSAQQFLELEIAFHLWNEKLTNKYWRESSSIYLSHTYDSSQLEINLTHHEEYHLIPQNYHAFPSRIPIDFLTGSSAS